MPIQLQETDKYLIDLLAEDFLLLTREQIQQLIPRSIRPTNKRLALLVEAKVLSRREPANQLSSSPPLYYLGEHAAIARGWDPEPFKERRIRAKNFGDSYLPHLHLINSVHIKFRAYKEKDYEFGKWVAYDNPKSDDGRNVSLRPDGRATFTKHSRSFTYFIEVDRGTERGEAIRKKIEQYHSLEKLGEWNPSILEWFRVLFIATEVSRAKGLLKLFPSETFWAATTGDVLSRPLFDEYWISKERKSLPLDIGPDAKQLEQIEAQKDAWLFASAPAPPAPKIEIRLTGQGLSPSEDPPVINPEKPEETNPTTRLWLKLAGGVAIGCAVVVLGWYLYGVVAHAYQSYQLSNREPQIYDTQPDNSNMKIALFAVVGFIFTIIGIALAR
jgi:Replication-relaxation